MLYRPVGGERLEPRCYVGEIKSHERPEFHIANREDDITRLLRQVAHSRKPNFAMIGDPGNGKSMTLDYIISIITGSKRLPKEHRWYELFETIKKKVRGFQARDYIFLPNLQDPFRPVVLDFAQKDFMKAVDTTRKYSKEIIKLTRNIGRHEKIYPRLTQKGYREYVAAELRHAYQELYAVLDNAGEYHADFDIIPTRNLSSFELKYKFLVRPNWENIRQSMGLEKTRKRKGKTYRVTKEDTKRILRNRFREKIRTDITTLLSSPFEMIVKGWTPENMQEVIATTMREIDAEYQKISDLRKEGVVPYFRGLAKTKTNVRGRYRISPESVGWFCKQIQKIEEGIDAPDTVKKWMADTTRYFRENPKAIQSALLEVYKSARKYSPGRRKNPRQVRQVNPLVDGGNGTSFELTHGKNKISLDRILMPQPYVLSKGGELTIKHPKSFSDEEMWGKVRDPSEKKGSRNGPFPPHRCFTPGYLMQSSILVLRDNMEGFFKALLGSEVKEAAARRQTVLTLVEEGDLMVEKYGISFNIHSPTMIIGCDNQEPFFRHHSESSQFYEPDLAMKTRFVLFPWEDYARNEPATRRGSISVINDAITKFNRENKTELSLSPETADVLLNETIQADLIQLNYRRVIDRVFEIMSFGKSQGKSGQLQVEDIIAFNRDKEPPTRFTHVAQELENRIGIPEPHRLGQVWSVGANIGGSGVVDVVKSGHIIDLAKDSDRAFQLFDTEAGLASKDTRKGFEEAVSFVKGQLERPVRFMMRTSFDRHYQGVCGPSASLPIALAMMSSLSNTPIRSDTVMTGGVSFHDGAIGPMGALYEKALAIWKTGQVLQERGMKGKMRFLFPAENYRDLRQQLRLSPYPVEEEIDLIPVKTFEEAFHLSTANSKVNLPRIASASKRTYAKALKKARTNTTRWNARVRAGYETAPTPPDKWPR